MGKGEAEPTPIAARCLAGATAAAMLLLAILLSACGSATEDATGGGLGNRLYVVGYSGLGSAYKDTLEPEYEKYLHVFDEAVSFNNSFGPSGKQSEAVVGGQPASLVHLEQAGAMERLVDAGVVDEAWDEQPYNGIVHWTVIVFIVRKGNPDHVHKVQDLMRDDIDVIVPNPFRSDTGRWSVMDIYATLIHERESEAEALAGVRRLLEKAVSQPASASEALARFLEGEGDVLLAYESQAIQAVEAGQGKYMRFVVPHQTIRVDTPIAVTKDAPEPAAEEFLDYLWSDPGQVLWAEAGYRPVNLLLVDQERFFPREAFHIASFGGWAEVNEKFFDPETGSIAEIERELGVPTEG